VGIRRRVCHDRTRLPVAIDANEFTPPASPGAAASNGPPMQACRVWP